MAPDVIVKPVPHFTAFDVSIVLRNVGTHPCEVMQRGIHLHIGDETYDIPSFKEWVLLVPQLMVLCFPAGHVNEQGIQRIRDARYKSNRIELSFELMTRSMEKRFEKSRAIANEINVQGEVPFAAFRPEWIKEA